MEIKPQDYSKYKSNSQGDLKFFKLANDKDSALVRFLYHRPEEIQAIAAHTLNLGNNTFKTIACLRTPDDAVDACPLCASEAIKSKANLYFYIHMLVYPKDRDGNIIGAPEHQVWQRPLSFYEDLDGWGQRMRDLSSTVFEIQRCGVGLQTTYKLYTTDYTVQECPITEDDFSKVTTMLGRMCLTKTADEMNYFIQFGSFPAKQDENAAPAPRQAYTQPAYTQPAYTNTQPNYAAPSYNTYNQPAPTGVQPGVYSPVSSAQAAPASNFAAAVAQPVAQPAAEPAYQPAAQNYFAQQPTNAAAPVQQGTAAPIQRRGVPTGRRSN